MLPGMRAWRMWAGGWERAFSRWRGRPRFVGRMDDAVVVRSMARRSAMLVAADVGASGSTRAACGGRAGGRRIDRVRRNARGRGGKARRQGVRNRQARSITGSRARNQTEFWLAGLGGIRARVRVAPAYRRRVKPGPCSAALPASADFRDGGGPATAARARLLRGRGWGRRAVPAAVSCDRSWESAISVNAGTGAARAGSRLPL